MEEVQEVEEEVQEVDGGGHRVCYNMIVFNTSALASKALRS